MVHCDVVLWPDNDQSGKQQAENAAGIISRAGLVRSIKLLSPPPDFPSAADIIDVVRDCGWDCQQVLEFVGTATPYSHRDSCDATENVINRGKHKATVPTNSAAFRLTEDAVIYTDPDRDKDQFKICGRLEVIALTRDAKGENWGVCSDGSTPRAACMSGPCQ